IDEVPLKMEVFDLVKLTKDIISSFEENSSKKNITVSMDKKYEPIYVRADRPKISQVLTNLIANSINYSKEDGATLIRFYFENQSIITEVSDNGIGISEKDMPRLF